MADILRVVGTIAGIGGLGLGVFLLVYRDFVREFIRTRAFRDLSPAQATMLLGASIALTFAVAVLGIFAGLSPPTGPVPFLVLVGILLMFVLAVLVILRRPGTRDLPRTGSAFARVASLVDEGRLDDADRMLAAGNQNTAECWYWRSRIALARDNPVGALSYVDEALRRDAGHADSVAQKVRLLLLSTKRGDRTRARDLADRSSGLSDSLDAWLTCLAAEGMFAPGLRTDTELWMRCPFPTPSTVERT